MRVDDTHERALTPKLPSRRDCTVLSAEEYLELVVSRRHLLRADDPEGALLGLLDPQTGRRYVTPSAYFERGRAASA